MQYPDLKINVSINLFNLGLVFSFSLCFFDSEKKLS